MESFASPEIIAFLAAALVFFLFLPLLRGGSGGGKVKLTERIHQDTSEAQIHQALEEMKQNAPEASESLSANASWLSHKDRELRQSGTGITLPVYLSVLAVSMLGIFIVIWKLMDIAWLGVPFSLLGIVVPEQMVKSRVQANVNKFNEQLVKALRRMASVMRSGGTIKQALLDVSKARSIPANIRIEFTKVLTDVEYTNSIEAALYRLWERTGSGDVHSLAVAVEVQKKLGGDLARTFDLISHNISARNMQMRDVKATLAQISATTNMLAAMPFVMGGGIALISPGYFDPLFANFVGRLVLLGILAAVVFGIFLIKKISAVKV